MEYLKESLKDLGEYMAWNNLPKALCLLFSQDPLGFQQWESQASQISNVTNNPREKSIFQS